VKTISTEKEITANSHKISLSNLDKIFFPESGITKGEILEYYQRIWKYMKPFVVDRPIVMQRFPDGIKAEGFFQKKAADYFPYWIENVKVKHKKDQSVENYVLCNNQASLLYLANQGCLTFHAWLSQKGSLEVPDQIVFDFDPSDDDMEKVQEGAMALNAVFEKANLRTFPMTTGSRGIHVIIPISDAPDFDEVRNVARKIAQKVADENSEILTTKTNKEQRGNKVFLDYLRNSYGQTSVVPYSVRNIESAPVAAPMDWDELKNKRFDPERYHIKNIFQRLAQKPNPWKDIDDNPVHFSKIRELL
jgi:bifunctional non-homologous end joining protein LigD